MTAVVPGAGAAMPVIVAVLEEEELCGKEKYSE
jgi:hypothetical protein